MADPKRLRLAHGAAAGVAAGLAFSAVHAKLIFPTPALLLEGIPISLLAGVALGRANHALVEGGWGPLVGWRAVAWTLSMMVPVVALAPLARVIGPLPLAPLPLLGVGIIGLIPGLVWAGIGWLMLGTRAGARHLWLGTLLPGLYFGGGLVFEAHSDHGLWSGLYGSSAALLTAGLVLGTLEWLGAAALSGRGPAEAEARS